MRISLSKDNPTSAIKTKNMLSPTLLTLLISVLSSLVNPSLALQDDRCPRPEAIAPCQCRTRGPTIQGKYIVFHIGARYFSEVLFEFLSACDF